MYFPITAADIYNDPDFLIRSDLTSHFNLGSGIPEVISYLKSGPGLLNRQHSLAEMAHLTRYHNQKYCTFGTGSSTSKSGADVHYDRLMDLRMDVAKFLACQAVSISIELSDGSKLMLNLIGEA
jgi:hypothetical protein